MTRIVTAIGLDVHARSTTAFAVNILTGETECKTFKMANPWTEIAAWSKKFEGPVVAAYESGCLGYEPYRILNESGLDTRIAAVSCLAKSPEEKRRKNDKADAERIARAILAHDIKQVYVPDRECEGLRDLIGQRACAVDAVKRAKQQITGLVQRQGFIWDERTKSGKPVTTWGVAYRKWLGGIKLEDPTSQAVLKRYIRNLGQRQEELKEIEAAISTIVRASARWRPVVDALLALNGVGFISAVTYACEYDDFSRFGGGRDVSKYFGMVPSEHSTGTKHRQGSITKCGPTLVRRTATEGAWSFARAVSDRKKLPADANVSAEILAHAKKGNRRMRLRRAEMAEQGKQGCVANTATGRELLCWVWAIGLMAQQEMASSSGGMGH